MSYLGKVAYKYYYKPKTALQYYLFESEAWRGENMIEKGKCEMEEAAKKLVFNNTQKGVKGKVEIDILTGKNHYHQMAFCLKSLFDVVDFPLHINIYDDGSIDNELKNLILKQIPSVTIYSNDECEEKLEKQIPINKFSYLRTDNIHLKKKLLYTRAFSDRFSIILDCDTLFFKNPIEIKSYYQTKTSFFMQDRVQAYHVNNFDSIHNRKLKVNIPDKLNAGLVGLDNRKIDWEELEYWLKCLDRQTNNKYYIEQTAMALLAARQNAIPLSETEYITWPHLKQIKNRKAIMHHYVMNSRNTYYKYLWRTI